MLYTTYLLCNIFSDVLQEYVGHFKAWDTPCPPVKTLCPLDPEKVGKKSSEQEGEDSSKEENNERKRRRNHFGGARPRGEQSLLAPSVAHAVNINGRRVLLCSFNGITFQVSISLSLFLLYMHIILLTYFINLLSQIPVESDESDTDQRNGHSSDEEGAKGSADEAHSDDPPPPENSGEGSGANGKSIRKEKVEDSDSELNHSDDNEDEFEAGDSQGGMDQSECSTSELVDSMEQDLDGSNQPDSC